MFVWFAENGTVGRFFKHFFFVFVIAIFIPVSVNAVDENPQSYPDKKGREAMRLWSERERDREVADALRRYWDYWSSTRRRGYSAYRLWYEMEQTQRWLEDPDHNPPPPPPPGMVPPPYPYMAYPPPWSFGPWYLYPYHLPYHQPTENHNNYE